MSYEIVKKIRIDGNKVFLTSDSNNVFPKSYVERENTYLSKLLQSEGMEALLHSRLEKPEVVGLNRIVKFTN